MEYGAALALQRSLREQRIAGEAPDTLLLVEHPAVVTLGRRTAAGDLLMSRELLQTQGVAVFDVERGGRATFHGPGQLVAYPIISLRERGLSVPRYVAALEEAVIEYLGTLGLEAARRPGYPGVWVRGRKIAAIGVHLRQWVSMHGVALNLSTDLAQYAAIVPCGITDAEVTSVAAEMGSAELGNAPPLSAAGVGVAAALAASLRYDGVEWARMEALTGR
ncbi:MAG: lipoyl(octanoyl) transferase LipB [Dehalococcoidia bacterium]|nr:lipoyl(octanoyl) transferase LipB [Dehalococcoidia bacterium]